MKNVKVIKSTITRALHYRPFCILAILLTTATASNSGDLKCFPVAVRMGMIFEVATGGPDGFSLKGAAAEKLTSGLAARGLGITVEEFKQEHPEQYRFFADEALKAYKLKITDTSAWYISVGRRCLIRFNQTSDDY